MFRTHTDDIDIGNLVRIVAHCLCNCLKLRCNYG